MKLTRGLGLIAAFLLVFTGIPFAHAATVTLPVVCYVYSGTLIPSALYPSITLSGGAISPTSETCNGQVTNFTVNVNATVTITTGSCFTFTCFQFVSGSTYTSTATTTACAAGTCAIFSITEYPVTQGDNTVGLGNCPSKDTATFVLVNNTMYLFPAFLYPGANTVASLQAEVASVTSSVTAQTLQFAIYAAVKNGPISNTNPLFLIPASVYSTSLAAGTKNTLVTSTVGNINVQGGSLGGYVYAIALRGTSKITMNQSGLNSFAGQVSLGDGPTQFPSQMNALGQTATNLFFCATSTYTNAVFTTASVTSTSTTTTTTTIQGTSTVIVNGANVASPTFWYIPILIIAFPLVAFLTIWAYLERRERPNQ